MAFPVSPTEGQTYTENNTVWIYSSTAQQWFRSQVNPENETFYKFGGSASATGAAGEIQYTDGTNLAASPNLVWDDVNDELEVGGDVVLDDGGTFTTTLQTITPTANRTVSLPNATGTVALVAGSSGQLVYNNAGAQAGVPGSTVGATGDVTLALNGAASTPPLELTGTWFTGGNTTTTKPQVLIEPAGTTSNAWSANGTGLGVNATSTFGGRLFDFQVNGTSRAVLDSAGRLLVGTASSTSNARLVLQANTGGATGGAVAILQNGQSAATIGSSPADLGYIWFADNAGNRFAEIIGQTDGTAGTNDYPGRLVFYTTPDGSPTSVERMRIKSTGIVNIANTPTYADNAAATAGGLVAGDVYRTSTGQLMIRF